MKSEASLLTMQLFPQSGIRREMRKFYASSWSGREQAARSYSDSADERDDQNHQLVRLHFSEGGCVRTAAQLQGTGSTRR